MMRVWVRRAVWAGVAAVLVGGLIFAFRPAPVDVDVGMTTHGPLRLTVEAEGKTRIKERYVVSAPLGGQLLRVVLHPGDSVVARQTILAAIEPGDPGLLDVPVKTQAEARVRATEASCKQAEAVLGRARQAHHLATTQLDRLRRLRSAGSVAAEEHDAAETRERVTAEEVRAAEFGVKVAAFEHEQAKAALIRVQPRSGMPPQGDRFEIRSPIGGKVLRVFQESEAVVAPGTRLLEIGDPDDLEMEIEVLSTDAVKLPPGAKLVVEQWGGPEPLYGRVRVVEPEAFLKVSALGVEEQWVNVIADFTSPPEKRRRLGDAYRLEAQIVVWEADDVLRVPAGALFRRGAGWAVFAVRDGRARLTPITVGQSNGSDAEVLDGLSVGEQVILHPSDRVADGVKILPR
jgi:HlyD family secretion protein